MSNLENVERIVVAQNESTPPKPDKLAQAQHLIVESIEMVREIRNTKLGMRVRGALRKARERRKQQQ